MDELKDRLEKLKDLTKVQCDDGNWNYNEYMRGMANGMILAVAVLTETEPIWKEEKDMTPDGTEAV